MEFLDGFIISKEAKELYLNQKTKKVTRIIKYKGKEYKYESERKLHPKYYKKATVAYNWLKDNYEKYKQLKKFQIYKEFKKDNNISEHSYSIAYDLFMEKDSQKSDFA